MLEPERSKKNVAGKNAKRGEKKKIFLLKYSSKLRNGTECLKYNGT